jgi:hypothetical protein
MSFFLYEKYKFPAIAIIANTFNIKICAILLSFILSIKVYPFLFLLFMSSDILYNNDRIIS